MLKARYYEADGAQRAEQDLPEWLFDGVVNEHVLHQVVKAYLSNQRQGTAAAKSRGQVAGGSSKPWRQKGTGRSRQGTIRAVQWAGGGVAFPPIPRSWRQRIPKKVRALARRSAFNTRAQDQRVILVNGLDFEAPKTKQLLLLLAGIGVKGRVLILTDGHRESVYLSGRNVPDVEVRPFGQESAYDILRANVVVIEKTALDRAGPSEADRDAQASRRRGEPEVRSRKRASQGAQAERQAARRHRARARSVAAEAGAVETDALAPRAAPEEGSISVATAEPPRVAELADFLSRFDSLDEVETLKARDSRKTAQAHYDARMEELSGGADAEEEGGDA